MTHPLTPREKVARIVDPKAFDHPTVHPQHLVARRAVSFSKADAILTALASGSGDHAELARLAEEAGNDTWIADGDCVEFAHPEARGHPIAVTNHEGTYPDSLGRAFAAFIAAANPATVLALLAEIAALRGENEHVKKLRHQAIDRSRLWEIDAIKWETRATEAERKLAEAGRTLELAAIRFDEIYEAAEVDDVAYRNEATIHGINGLADVAQAEIRTFLSKEAERG